MTRVNNNRQTFPTSTFTSTSSQSSDLQSCSLAKHRQPTPSTRPPLVFIPNRRLLSLSPSNLESRILNLASHILPLASCHRLNINNNKPFHFPSSTRCLLASPATSSLAPVTLKDRYYWFMYADIPSEDLIDRQSSMDIQRARYIPPHSTTAPYCLPSSSTTSTAAPWVVSFCDPTGSCAEP